LLSIYRFSDFDLKHFAQREQVARLFGEISEAERNAEQNERENCECMTRDINLWNIFESIREAFLNRASNDAPQSACGGKFAKFATRSRMANGTIRNFNKPTNFNIARRVRETTKLGRLSALFLSATTF